MKCPNCGREVRSKTSCAYCGQSFTEGDKSPSARPVETKRETQADVQEIKQETFRDTSELRANRETQGKPPVVPKTKRKGGNVIWNILKLLIAVAVVFLLF